MEFSEFNIFIALVEVAQQYEELWTYANSGYIEEDYPEDFEEYNEEFLSIVKEHLMEKYNLTGLDLTDYDINSVWDEYCEKLWELVDGSIFVEKIDEDI